MTPMDVVKSIVGLMTTGATLIVLVFINFVFRKADASVFGAALPLKWVHAALGPALVLINSALLVFLAALYRMEVSATVLREIQAYNPKFVLGPVLNPFYLGNSTALNCIGYASLIVLWWLGMHSFTYSIGLNDPSPFTFGWSALIGVLFLALGLASMLAIQGTWNNLGIEAYRAKWIGGFVGIGIGCFLPPLILRLGVPSLLSPAA